MATRYKVNATAVLGGEVYDVPIEIVAWTRNLQPGTRTFNIQDTYPSYVVEIFQRELGFNPLNIVSHLTTNTSGCNWAGLRSGIKSLISNIGINYIYYEQTANFSRFSNVRLGDGTTSPYNPNAVPGVIETPEIMAFGNLGDCSLNLSYGTGTGRYRLSGSITMIPDQTWDGSSFNTQAMANNMKRIGFVCEFRDMVTYWGGYGNLTITIEDNLTLPYIISWCDKFNASMDYLMENGDLSFSDSRNPYGPDIAITGGGHGDPFLDVDEIEKIEFPELPTLSASSAGFITIYNPSLTQLQSLAGFLWSQPFDIDTFKKLFSNPMDAIIGLGIIPVSPTHGSSRSVKFGNVDSEITMPVISNQFVEKDCGSVQIKKWVDCFLDYNATKIEIYVPYCGTYSLDPVEVMGKTIHLKYHIDCLTGGCAAMLAVGGSVMYQWNGSCITNVPLTAENFAGAIQNAVSAVASIASGGSPVAGVTNAVMNFKPNIEKAGNMGGSAGLMSVQQPYVIITRPNMSVPAKLNTFTGNTLNVTMNLSTVTGFTQVELIHLDGIPCTDDERDELLTLLKRGVIF